MLGGDTEMSNEAPEQTLQLADPAVLTAFNTLAGVPFLCSRITLAASIPDKKRKKAGKKARIPDGEQLLILADDTLLGDGGGGIFVTDKAIYMKGLGEKPKRIGFDDVRALKLVQDPSIPGSGVAIEVNDDRFAFTTGTFAYHDVTSLGQFVRDVRPGITVEEDVRSQEAQPIRIPSHTVSEAFGELRNAPRFEKHFHLAPQIPEKKEKKARKRAKIPNVEVFLVLIDTTLRGDGADGLFITDRAVYIKEMWTSVKRIGFDELETVELNQKGSRVELIFNEEKTELGVYELGIEGIRPFVDFLKRVSKLREKVVFQDQALESAVRLAIGKPSGDIVETDLDELASLDAENLGIAALGGIEYCPALTELRLGRNRIADISALAYLPRLAVLTLGENRLSGISALSQLKAMTHLDLSGNRLSDVSALATLSALSWLDLSSNRIADISPLSNLGNLTWIDLSSNRINDISPLANLKKLTWANLSGNLVSNLSPLSDLANLKTLSVIDNEIRDVTPLLKNKGLRGGGMVQLSGNPLSDTSENVHLAQLRDRGVRVHGREGPTGLVSPVPPEAAEIKHEAELETAAPRTSQPPARAVPATDFPPELNDLYEEPSLIGVGGFAQVYRAKRRQDGTEVAVKVPSQLDARTGKSFLIEITSWQHLKHRNILELYDFNILPIPYLQLELCPRSLSDLDPPINVEQASSIVFHVAEGLKYAHSKQVVHRDLKPQNILLQADVPKIADWGLSKVMTESRVSQGHAFSPLWAAPEQLAPEKFGRPDNRTDIYQLGVVFYELVTGELPSSGDNFTEVMGKIIGWDPVPPSVLIADSAPLDRIILRCLRKEMGDRYQRIEELQKDLADYLRIEYTDSLARSQGNMQRSGYYCAELCLVHLMRGDLKEALKYAGDLTHYTSSEAKQSLTDLVGEIEFRLRESTDVSDEMLERAATILHRAKMGW